jgi:hypothetical protein
LLVKVKSPGFAPFIVIEVMCSAALPVLVIVRVWAALLEPCAIVGKTIDVGLNETAARGIGVPLPVPVIAISCGESGASSLTIRLAVRAPLPSGENVAHMTHVP